MTRLLVATRNRGKQDEFRGLFAGRPWHLVFPDDVGIPESAAEAALESFPTFAENARAKATWFARLEHLPSMADDSGLEVDALGGDPGVLSRRYAGVIGPDADVTAANNARLIEVMREVPDHRRSARFRCALVLVRPDGTEMLAEGVTEGRILRAPRGANGFGYDPLFFSEELGQTFGEASAAEKGAVSHRARAVAALWQGLV